MTDINTVQTIICDQSKMRLDAYLASQFSDVSRSYLAELISIGKVSVNGSRVKSSYKIEVSDRIVIDFPEPEHTSIEPENIPLDVVYEDQYLIVINKPQAMVVHPAPGHRTGTLVHALLHYCKDSLSDINGVIRPGIIHRIDKDTSGLIIAVKDNDTHLKMSEMMSRHEIKRLYRCCVYGMVNSDKGTIDAPVGRSKSDRKKMTVTAEGKYAISHFEVLERLNNACDLSVRLETGRTHQIRVHMSYIGHPVIGDPVYAPKRKSMGLEGQALHSSSLMFIHPQTGKEISLFTELPDYYKLLLDRLRAVDS